MNQQPDGDRAICSVTLPVEQLGCAQGCMCGSDCLGCELDCGMQGVQAVCPVCTGVLTPIQFCNRCMHGCSVFFCVDMSKVQVGISCGPALPETLPRPCTCQCLPQHRPIGATLALSSCWIIVISHFSIILCILQAYLAPWELAKAVYECKNIGGSCPCIFAGQSLRTSVGWASMALVVSAHAPRVPLSVYCVISCWLSN